MQNEEQNINTDLVKYLQSHEMRIDFNYHSIVQLTFLIEFLIEQLAAKGIEIDVSKFDEYQKTQMQTVQESIEKAKEDPDFEKKTKEIFDQIQSELNEKIKL
jgi:hypothetical protein